MRVLAILGLSILLIIASFCCLVFFMCAASSGGNLGAGEKVWYAVGVLVALGSIIGIVKLIGKVNRSL